MNDVTTLMQLQDVEHKAKLLQTIQKSMVHNVRASIQSIISLSSHLEKITYGYQSNQLLRAIYTAANMSGYMIKDMLDI